MAEANKLIPFILKWEGGFSDRKEDRGGPTNKGITIATFRNFYGEHSSVDDLKNITEDQWKCIFVRGYWGPWKANMIHNQSVANICVDWAWASGTVTSIRQVQRLIGVNVDGIVGPKTLAVLNSIEPSKLFSAIKQARMKFVDNIVEKDPVQLANIRGWKNRINDINFSY